MRRMLVIAGLLVVASTAFASQATAGTTTVSVRMSFTEPIIQNVRSGCPVLVLDGFCGMGIVVPFGHATETILFGGDCGGACDFRTVKVAGGTLYLDEFFSDGSCPGSCQPNFAEPSSGTLTDVIVGGTGVFTGLPECHQTLGDDHVDHLRVTSAAAARASPPSTSPRAPTGPPTQSRRASDNTADGEDPREATLAWASVSE